MSLIGQMPPPELPPEDPPETLEEFRQRVDRLLQGGCAELNFGDEFIGPAGCEVVAQALAEKAGANVTALYLGGNGIGDTGAQALADALRAGTGLQILDLRSNGIGDVGARALAMALSGGSNVAWQNRLESLDLWFNKIKEAGYMALEEATQVNESLLWLRLDVGRPAIRQALERNIKASIKFVILTIHPAPPDRLCFTTMAGSELETLSVSLEDLAAPGGFGSQRELLAAKAGVRAERLRLTFPDGRLLDAADEGQQIRTLLEEAAA